MPFRRNRTVIKTDKHEITWSLLAADFGTATTSILLVDGVEAANKNTSTECMVGSHVRSIYIEMNMAAQTTTNPKVLHWEVLLKPFSASAGSSNPSLYYQVARNQVIKRGMEMLPSDVATVYKRIFVVRVPKKAQRIGLDDQIALVFRCSSTETINVCGFAIYKEQY